jgi:DNA-binding transcriptional LysR family regulator
MVDRLEAMSILVMAVETGSFSAASRRLGTPLPTISRKISELETHLQTRLLIRSTRKLVLTEAGAAYLSVCKRVLEQVGEAERAASGEYSLPKGDIVVTAPIVFGRLHMLPGIAEFLATYPEINVRLVLADRNMDLIGDHIDVALRIGALPDSGLVATRLGTVRRVICGSPSCFAGRKVPKSPVELSAFPTITFDAHGPVSSWSFGMPGSKGEQIVQIRPRLAVNTAEASIDAAIAGIGVTRVLSYQVARAVSEAKLQIILAKYEPKPLPVSLMHAGQGLVPRKVRAFLDFAAPFIQARLAESSVQKRFPRIGQQNALSV